MDSNSAAVIGIIIAPFIVFLVIVAPVWIIMHYIAMSRRDRVGKTAPISAEDQEHMGRMINLLEKMESRIITLEKILDAEDPRWRDKRTANERI
jgi:phage shock protein B